MSAPPNWPVNKLVYPEEAWRLAAEGLGIPFCGSYQAAGKVVVRDATGRRLEGVVACCEATGDVIAHRKRNGEYMVGTDQNLIEIHQVVPAPLQISYGEPSEA